MCCNDSPWKNTPHAQQQYWITSFLWQNHAPGSYNDKEQHNTCPSSPQQQQTTQHPPPALWATAHRVDRGASSQWWPSMSTQHPTTMMEVLHLMAAGGASLEQDDGHSENGEGHDTTMYGGPTASDTPGDKAPPSTAVSHCLQGWTVVLQVCRRWQGWHA